MCLNKDPSLAVALPGNASLLVLPGDGMFQAQRIVNGKCRPVILHGYGGAKKEMPSSLAALAKFGWVFMAAAMVGSASSRYGLAKTGGPYLAHRWAPESCRPICLAKKTFSCSVSGFASHVMTYTLGMPPTAGCLLTKSMLLLVLIVMSHRTPSPCALPGYDPTANGPCAVPCQSRRRRFASSYRIAERHAKGERGVEYTLIATKLFWSRSGIMHVAIAWDHKPLLLLATALLPNRTTDSFERAGPPYDKQRIQMGLRSGNTVLICFRSGVGHFQSVLIALAADLHTNKPWQGQHKFWKYVSPLRTYSAWLPEQLARTYCSAALDRRSQTAMVCSWN